MGSRHLNKHGTPRALLAKGITGKLTLLDGMTGKLRIIINIEKAAKLRVEEGPHGPRFVKWRGTVVDGPHTSETDEAEGIGVAKSRGGRGT